MAEQAKPANGDGYKAPEIRTLGSAQELTQANVPFGPFDADYTQVEDHHGLS